MTERHPGTKRAVDLIALLPPEHICRTCDRAVIREVALADAKVVQQHCSLLGNSVIYTVGRHCSAMGVTLNCSAYGKKRPLTGHTGRRIQASQEKPFRSGSGDGPPVEKPDLGQEGCT